VLIKKPLGILMTGVLTFGLAACNNGDNAVNDTTTSRLDRDNNITNVRNGRDNTFRNVRNDRGPVNDYGRDYRGRNVNNNNNGFLLGNGRDDGIDHNGPLTEDYTNRDNNDSDIDRGRNTGNRGLYNVNNTNRNGNNGRLNVNNNNRTGTQNLEYDRNFNSNWYNVNNGRYDQNRSFFNNSTRRDQNNGLFNVNNRRDNDRNLFNVNNTRDDVRLPNKANNNRTNTTDVGDDNISADRTSLNSKNYPHTRAILIQEAKFKYIPFGSAQWRYYGSQQPGQAPNQQQQQQQATPQQPAEQQQQQAAPQQPAQQQQPAQKQPAAQEQPKAQAPATGDASQFVQQVIDLTNAERSKNGLPALKGDSQLNGVAQKKSVDMQQNNYFSHTSPTYGSPFDMMRDMGVSYKTAGENIAQGQRTPQEVVKAWMNSEGHRKNILSPNFTHIGVGYEKTGHHWTQMFIGK
jgi:uncharacterized YkwD family protein